MNIVYRARVVLINIGKTIPFVLCGIVLISYFESLISILTRNFVEWNGYIIPRCTISWIIGDYFEYDFITLLALIILSISTQTCRWNKISCLYLGINLIEKSYFDFELEPTYIYIICIFNIIICSFLCYKGLKRLL